MRTVTSLRTPALVLDAAAFERNGGVLRRMCEAAGVALRPHAKAHKCSSVARWQMQQGGAVGVCCQTVREAEMMARGGVRDVFVSNEVVDALAPRVAALACDRALGARVSVCVDDAGSVDALAAAMRREHERDASAQAAALGVLIEVDVGQGRCGVPPDVVRVLDLARRIVAHAPLLRFVGVHAYHGWYQHARDDAERAAGATRNADSVRGIVAALRADAALGCAVVTGGGSGTFQHEAATGLYTEVQPGSAYFMDVDYALNRGMPPFEHSFFLLTTVLSDASAPSDAAGAARIVLDGGTKAHSVDCGMPWPYAVLRASRAPGAGLGEPGEHLELDAVLCGPHVRHLFRDVRASDEHTQLVFDPSAEALERAQLGAGALADGTLRRPRRGDRVLLVPGHVDPTFNLHDHVALVRNLLSRDAAAPPSVEDVWPIDARGFGPL